MLVLLDLSATLRMITYPCLACITMPLQMWDCVLVLFLPHTPSSPPPPPLAFFFLSLVYNSIRRIFHIPCCSYLRVLGSPSFFLLVLHLFSLCTLVTGNLANTHLPALWVEQSTILLKICFPWHLLLYSRSLADGCAFMTSHRFPSYISPFRLHAHEQSNSGVTLDV